ncbi:MAG: thioredoxin-disulfide reductase [Gemmatimonadaceae bacterium]|nr:thioredoxin-disulfide reductase [Gemmatimonadaceae bacterium]MDQ3519276.1 thioredoxin-disulfide reductase [Gemmatimonadota bacterium]
MPETFDYEVVIVGAGPAGLCAGMYAGRAMLKAVVIERGASGGELLNTEIIEDYPGFEHIDGWDLAQKFESHALKFGVEIHRKTVETVRKLDAGTFETVTDGGDVYRSPAVIATAGGTPIKLGVPGELEFAGKGVSYCAICDGAFFRGHTIAVIGGGDAAAEESDFLTRYAEKVYLIHRREELRASKILQKRVFENPKIVPIWNTVVERIDADEQGLVNNIVLRDARTAETRNLAATGVFIFIGFRPNTGIIEGHINHDASGYLTTDANMETSIRGLFAAGDLRSQLTRQVTTAVGDATTATIAAEKYLTARKGGQMNPEITSSGGYAV